MAATSAQEIAKRIGATAGRIDINGNQIYFEVQGEGLPVVFLHDGILHRIGFNHQTPAFSKNYTVIHYDRPGYGDSPAPKVSYSHLGVLERLLELLHLEQVILIGSSRGGQIALDFALVHPEQVTKLVLVGPAVSGWEYSDHMGNRGWRNTWGESAAEQIAFWANDPWLTAQENTAARQFLSEALITAPQNLEFSEIPATPPGFEGLKRLSEIKVPTLIIMGEADIADNHAVSGVLQHGISGAVREIVTQAGHLPYLEQPEKFNKLVLNFLD